MTTNPLELFAFLGDLPEGEGPTDISVFEEDTLLFASFDNGRERIVHAPSISKAKLRRFLEESGALPGIPAAE